MTQLGLSDTRWTYQKPHLHAHFIQFVVGVHKFCIGEISGMCGYRHQNKHFLHDFDAFERAIFTNSVTLPGFGFSEAVSLKTL